MRYWRSWRKSQTLGICPDDAVGYTKFLVTGLSLIHADILAELYFCCSTAPSVLTVTKNRKKIKTIVMWF